MTTDGNLRAIFREHLPRLMWTSIETGGTGLGVPDSHYLARATLGCELCGGAGERVLPGEDPRVLWKCECTHKPGIDGMIEYKQTDGHAVTLRPEQAAYLSRRARLGGRAWIAVRQRHQGGPRRGPPIDALHLVSGSLAVEARAGGLRCAALSQPPHWVALGGPARWPWAEVQRLLLS